MGCSARENASVLLTSAITSLQFMFTTANAAGRYGCANMETEAGRKEIRRRLQGATREMLDNKALQRLIGLPRCARAAAHR